MSAARPLEATTALWAAVVLALGVACGASAVTRPLVPDLSDDERVARATVAAHARQLDVAYADLDVVLGRNPRHARAYYAAAVAAAAEGRMPDAARNMRAYLKLAPDAPDAAAVRADLERAERGLRP